MYPKDSYAVYLDSGSDVNRDKDYTHIKAVLNEALNAYARNEGIMKREKKVRGKFVFNQRVMFPCVKQSPGSKMEAWYLINHMQEFVKDQQRLQFPSALDRWCNGLADASDARIRLEFSRIQQVIAGIICNDVLSRTGMYFNGFAAPPNDEIERRLIAQGDHRPFTIDGALPFPPKPRKTKK